MNCDRFPNSLFFRSANSGRLLKLLPALALVGLLLASTWVALAAGLGQSEQMSKNSAVSVPPEDFLAITWDSGTEPSSVDPFAFTQVIKELTRLTADDAQEYDIFGDSVSISGDTLVVGAIGEDCGPGDPFNDAGAAYVFERDQGGADNWGAVAKLTASDAQNGDRFASSISISGDTIVVGASEEDGAAYVFERNQGGVDNWGEVAKLSASDAQNGDRFASSISISGDTLVVGAEGEAGGPGDPLPRAGAAYVFSRDQGGANNWGEVVKLTAGDPQENDLFGSSVCISGDTIVVGAWHEDGGPGSPLGEAGAAYVFDRDQGGADNWGEVAKLTASDAQWTDEFGSSVSISGDTIVVGAAWEDGGPGDPLEDAGAAYVFGRNQGGADNWGEVAKLTASDAQGLDFFGAPVSISGNTIVVGAIFERGGTGDPLNGAGAAYVFGRDRGGANNWGEVAKLTASDAQTWANFGYSVSVSGDMIVVGAPGEDGGPDDPLTLAGAAYVFAPLALDPSAYLPLVIRD